jgi:hypothetical protein
MRELMVNKPSAFFRAEDVDIRIHLPCIIDAIILFQWVAGGGK